MPSFLVRRRRRWIIERAVDLSTFERNAPPIPPRHGSVNEPIPNYIAQARDPHIPARIRLKNPAQRYEIVRVRPALPVVPEQVGCRRPPAPVARTVRVRSLPCYANGAPRGARPIRRRRRRWSCRRTAAGAGGSSVASPKSSSVVSQSQSDRQ